MKSKHSRTLPYIFMVVGALTLGVVLLVWWMGMRVTSANSRMYQTREVIAELEDTLSTLRDAETGHRGYLLVGEGSYLEPYQAAAGRIGDDLKRLDGAVASGNLPDAQNAQIKRLVQAKLDEMALTIDLYKSKSWDEALAGRRSDAGDQIRNRLASQGFDGGTGPRAALAVVRSEIGKGTMDALRQVIGEVEAADWKTLEQERTRRDDATVLRTVTSMSLGLLDLMVLTWAFGIIRKGMVATEQQRELLEVTLGSIGDGVIVTNGQGEIAFMNGEAARLTGYSREEALGLPLPRVFHIVNEQSRAVVENPVDKVLRLGTVVGLANHTVLIGKAGLEVPIDDSGAPVQSPDGQVHGVVLIFRDFSVQKNAERAIRASEERLQLFVEHAPAAVAMFDQDMRYVIASQRWIADFHLESANLAGRSHYEIFPEIPQRWREIHKRCLAGAVESCDEEAFPRADGTIDWLKWEIHPWRYNTGEIGGIIIFSELITARKMMEDQLASVAQFPAENPHPVLRVGNDGHLAFANHATMVYLEQDGWQEGQVVPASLREPALEALATGKPAEFDVVRPGGGVLCFTCMPISGKGYANLYGRDVTEARRAEAALRESKVAAEAANKSKDHFLAVLSHELRTPLTPVLSVTYLMSKDAAMPERYRDDLEMIRRNVELEARLIDDLLDVTRIARGKIALERGPVELESILRWTVDVCKGEMDARRLAFRLDLGDAKDVVIYGDATRLQQVFWNLLKNAVKFTPAEGCVGIRCRLDGPGLVIVEIVDSGLGIEPDLIPRLFNAFEQGGAGTTRQFGGLGLGLAITKAMVELHGGVITATSAGRAKGATFQVRLPVFTGAQVSGDGKPAVAKDGRVAARRGLRILLVEDHVDTARIMGRLLAGEGYIVEKAGDVASALKVAGEQTFDLILSDLGLPDGTGLDLIRALRQQGSVVPAIALSGYGQDQDIQQSREAGFAAHLTKPVNIGLLANTIERIAGTH